MWAALPLRLLFFSLSGGSFTTIASIKRSTTVKPPFSDVTVGLFRTALRLSLVRNTACQYSSRKLIEAPSWNTTKTYVRLFPLRTRLEEAVRDVAEGAIEGAQRSLPQSLYKEHYLSIDRGFVQKMILPAGIITNLPLFPA